MREKVARIISVTVRRRRREAHCFLKMLLGERRLVCRAFRDCEVDEEDRVLRRKFERAMKIIERAIKIAFRHEGVAVIHQATGVSRTLNSYVAPKRFFGFPNLVALKGSVSGGAKVQWNCERQCDLDDSSL